MTFRVARRGLFCEALAVAVYEPQFHVELLSYDAALDAILGLDIVKIYGLAHGRKSRRAKPPVELLYHGCVPSEPKPIQVMFTSTFFFL